MRLVLAVAAWLCLWPAISGLSEVTGNKQPSAADWLLQEVKNNHTANFNQRCGMLDPAAEDERWKEPCRTMTPAELVSILLRSDIPRHGIRLIGAHIDSSLDLQNAKLTNEVRIERSRIDGRIDLTGAQLNGRFSLDGTQLSGLYAEDLQTAHAFHLQGAIVKGGILLRDAKIGGNLQLSKSVVEQTINANRIHVSGSLFMRSGG